MDQQRRSAANLQDCVDVGGRVPVGRLGRGIRVLKTGHVFTVRDDDVDLLAVHIRVDPLASLPFGDLKKEIVFGETTLLLDCADCRNNLNTHKRRTS